MIILLSSFIFWLIIAEVLLLFLLVERYDSGLLGGVSVVIFSVLLWWIGDVSIVSYITNSPLTTVAMFAGYMLCGSAWTITRWTLFVFKRKKKFFESKKHFINRYNLDSKVVLNKKSVEDGLLDAKILTVWHNYTRSGLNFDSYRARDAIIPKAVAYKYDIFRWIAYWPIDIVWYLIDDLIVDSIQFIYNKIRGLLQSIALKIFSDIEDEIK